MTDPVSLDQVLHALSDGVQRRVWTLTIPAPTLTTTQKDRKSGLPKYRTSAGWLTLNDRMHHMARAQLVRQWRTTTAQAALAAGLRAGMLRRARFDGLLQFTGATRRDTSNWQMTAKACLDALTRGTAKHPGIAVLPDDSPEYLHCEDCPHLTKDPVLLPKAPYRPLGVLVLTITDLSEEVRHA